MESSASLECLAIRKLVLHGTLINHTVEELAVLSPELLITCAAESIFLVYNKLPVNVQNLDSVKNCLRCNKHYLDCVDGPPQMIKDCYGCN